MLDKLIDSLDSVVWYNCHYDKLIEIKGQIKQLDKDSDNYTYDYEGDEQFQVIWMILVCMYGNYGTSPRHGWLELENKDEIINFIDLITKTSREAEDLDY